MQTSKQALSLASSLFGARQDMASHSYNTAGTMRPDMGAIKNGQPSLPTPIQSMPYVNLLTKDSGTVNPKMTHMNSGFAGMSPSKQNIGSDASQGPNHRMGNNPTHPAAQLASYLIVNRLTDPTMFYRG